MAALFSSPPFLSRPVTRALNFSSSPPSPQNPPPPPPNPPQQPRSPPPPRQPSAASPEQPQPISVKPREKQKAATAESTDWIASSLTRRFGLGAGLAWAAFLAVGVVSEQIKTRLEVSEQEAGTREVIGCESKLTRPRVGHRHFFRRLLLLLAVASGRLLVGFGRSILAYLLVVVFCRRVVIFSRLCTRVSLEHCLADYWPLRRRFWLIGEGYCHGLLLGLYVVSSIFSGDVGPTCLAERQSQRCLAERQSH